MTADADVVLTTGGTGLGPRDVTPEATRAVLDLGPRIAEALRHASLAITPFAMLSPATPGVFSAIGATLAAGREFASTDFTGARVAVVNEAFATRFYGSVNAVGKRFKQGGVTSRSGRITIIPSYAPCAEEGRTSALFRSSTPWAARTMDIVVRASTNTLALVTSVRSACAHRGAACSDSANRAAR